MNSITVSSPTNPSNTTAPTQFLSVGENKYAYRQFGSGPGLPLLFLQHFTGTLDNWDPAVTDALAQGRSVVLFESAGIGRSVGRVPTTVAGMADHAMKFLDGLGLSQVDVLGFSLGGMVAQVIALKRPALFRRIVLTGTGPEGGVGVAMDRPDLLKIFGDQKMSPSEKLLKLFFETTETSQSAGREFVQRLARRREDTDTRTTAEAAGGQLAAMSAWEKSGGEPYTDLKKIKQPVLVTNGNHDIMIPTVNSFTLSEHLPKRATHHLPGLWSRVFVSACRTVHQSPIRISRSELTNLSANRGPQERSHTNEWHL